MSLPKSSVEQIRARFDDDVERFSSLENCPSSILDASLMLDLVSQAAAAATPHATHLLDIGCGAGNYTLKMLQVLPNLRQITLVDLSQPMLDRAMQRVRPATPGQVTLKQADIRELALEPGQLDIILAAAVFHHLRDDEEWETVFAKSYDALRPGGSLWISDLVEQSTPPIQSIIWQRYGEYLTRLKGDPYRDHVFGYISQEDTPRSLMYQVDLLRRVGFRTIEILHKNCCFAAFGAIR